MPVYFDKPTSRLAVKVDTISISNLYRARQMFDLHGNQNASASFSIHWLTLLRETYRQAHKVHPKSATKRAVYLRNIFPHGVSLYRNPSRYLRWYLERNHGLLLGDPTGDYLIPINTKDVNLEFMPHPTPNALADNFTIVLLKYLRKPPKVRYVRKDQGYGFVEFTIPDYVYLGKPKSENRKNKFRITGFISDWEVFEFLKAELKKYVQLYRETMDDRYYRFLQSEVAKLGVTI